MNDFSVCCFLSLCASGSLRAAAAELSVSTDTVLRNVARLEEEVGFPLFAGETSDAVISDGGVRMREYFLDLAGELEEKERHLGAHRAHTALRVGWSEWSGCPAAFETAIRTFEQTHPDRTVSLRQMSDEQLLRFLENGEVDVAVVSRLVSRRIQAPCRVERLGEGPLCLVAPKDGAAAPVVYTAALCGDTMAARETAAALCGRLGLAAREVRVEENWDSAYLSVRLGHGVTVSPRNRRIMLAGDVFSCADTAETVTLMAACLRENGDPDLASLCAFLRTGEEAPRT